MKRITESPAADNHWPRQAVRSVECRRRDLVLRITDWMSDKDEPAYDVECYIGGVYDYNESKVCSRWNGSGKPLKSPAECKREAIAYAQTQIAKLL